MRTVASPERGQTRARVTDWIRPCRALWLKVRSLYFTAEFRESHYKLREMLIKYGFKSKLKTNFSKILPWMH